MGIFWKQSAPQDTGPIQIWLVHRVPWLCRRQAGSQEVTKEVSCASFVGGRDHGLGSACVHITFLSDSYFPFGEAEARSAFMMVEKHPFRGVLFRGSDYGNQSPRAQIVGMEM